MLIQFVTRKLVQWQEFWFKNISVYSVYQTRYTMTMAMGREMQYERDLGVKEACLAYNTTVHTSTFLLIGYILYLKLTGKWSYQTGLKWCKKGSRWLILGWERDHKLQYIWMLNFADPLCHSLRLDNGPVSLILRLYLEVVTS